MRVWGAIRLRSTRNDCYGLLLNYGARLGGELCDKRVTIKVECNRPLFLRPIRNGLLDAVNNNMTPREKHNVCNNNQ